MVVMVVVSQLDPSKGISAAQVQCRIHPLIACITVRHLDHVIILPHPLSSQESSVLYDLIYKLMKTLHTSEPRTPSAVLQTANNICLTF